MRIYFEEFLLMLRNRGTIKRLEKVVYNGHIPSLNDLYGSKHWRVRHNAAQSYHLIFSSLLKKFLKKAKDNTHKYSLYIFFNSRHDTDNVVGIEKYFTDMLVNNGYVTTDRKTHFRALVIVPDETLKKNTVEFLFATHADKC